MMGLGLFFQLCAYLIGIGFSAGGGNHPDMAAGAFIIVKLCGMTLPIVMLGWHVMVRHRTALNALADVMKWHHGLIVLFGLAFLSLPLAVDPGFSLQRLFYTLYGLLGLFALCAQYRMNYPTPVRIPVAIGHATWLGWGIGAVCAALMVFTGYDATQLRSAIQATGFVHPNMVASFCGHLLILQAVLWLHGKKDKKAFFTAMLLAAIIFLLFSRTVFLALMIVVAVMSFYTAVKTRKTYAAIPGIMLFVVAVIVLGIACFDPDGIQGILSIFLRNDTTQSLLGMTHRVELWKRLFTDLTPKIALLGNGYAVMHADFGVDFGTGIIYGAHNAYLSLFFGGGITVLAAFLYYLLCMKGAIRELPWHMHSILLASLVFFVLNCFAAEEIGVHISITLAYFVWLTSISLERKNV